VPSIHADRDEIKRRAEEDFLNLYLEHGGEQRWKSLRCFFHKDRTPSASIFKGRFYCFSCGANVDVIEFIERVRGEDFKGALAFLAARYGIPLSNGTLADAERREYAHRRARAETEAVELVAWKHLMVETLRNLRDQYLKAYHRGVQYIAKNSLEAPAGNLAADVVELYEERYLDLDERIRIIEQAPYAKVLPFFRRRSA
jgi:DNA primase